MEETTQPLSPMSPNDSDVTKPSQMSGVGLLAAAVGIAVVSGGVGYVLGMQYPLTQKMMTPAPIPIAVVESPAQQPGMMDTMPADTSAPLTYEFVKGVSLDNSWTERGIPLRSNSLREFESTDQCTAIYVSDLGALPMELESFIGEYYQVPVPIPQETYFATQYQVGQYPAVTIGPMGAGQVSNTVVDVRGRAVGINVELSGTPGCTSEPAEVKTVIESIKF